MLVKQILGSTGPGSVITVKPSTKLSEIAAILAEKHIGGLIVSDDGTKADGIVSERDIVRILAEKGSECMDIQAVEVMTSDLKTCGMDDTADEILQRMTDGRFRHMPVVVGDEMVGIVTIGDLVKARLSELSMEKDALQGMIMGR